MHVAQLIQLERGMPSTISKMDVKPLQSLFVQNGPLLCLKWKGAKTKTKKKPVTILSTIHDAMEILTKKKDSHGNRLPKPESIMQYTLHMSGVDLSDQYMAFHMSEKEHEMVEKGVLSYSKHDTPECLHSEQQIWETKVIT